MVNLAAAAEVERAFRLASITPEQRLEALRVMEAKARERGDQKALEALTAWRLVHQMQ